MITEPPASELCDLRREAWDALQRAGTVLLVTSDGRGQLVARPVRLQRLDDGSASFIATRSMELVDSVQRDPRVNVSCMSARDGLYLSISGTAQVDEDRAAVESLWSADAGAWYPDGPADPDLIAVHVGITQAEIWDEESSRMQPLHPAGRAALTGAPPMSRRSSAGDNSDRSIR